MFALLMLALSLCFVLFMKCFMSGFSIYSESGFHSLSETQQQSALLYLVEGNDNALMTLGFSQNAILTLRASLPVVKFWVDQRRMRLPWARSEFSIKLPAMYEFRKMLEVLDVLLLRSFCATDVMSRVVVECYFQPILDHLLLIHNTLLETHDLTHSFLVANDSKAQEKALEIVRVWSSCEEVVVEIRDLCIERRVPKKAYVFVWSILVYLSVAFGVPLKGDKHLDMSIRSVARRAIPSDLDKLKTLAELDKIFRIHCNDWISVVSSFEEMRRSG